MNHKIIFFVSCCLLSFTFSSAQSNAVQRLDEHSVGLEDKFLQAKNLLLLGKIDKAFTLLDSLRRTNTTVSILPFEIAKIHFAKNEYTLGENSLKHAIKLDSNNIYIRQYQAQIMQEIGQYEEAVAALKHIISLKPLSRDAYFDMLKIYEKNNDIANAIATLDRMESIFGFEANLQVKKAEIYDKNNQPDKAIEVLQSLSNKFPSEKKYLSTIVKLLHSHDRIKESKPYLEKILLIDPLDNDAKLGLVLMNNKLSGRDEYLTTLSPLISNPDAPVDIKIKELLPFVLKHADTNDSIMGKQLISLCDQLVLAHPNDPKSHSIFGDVLMNSGNTVAAVRQYERVLALDKKNFLIWEQLMYGLEYLQNNDRLYAVSDEALDFFPNNAMVYYFHAIALINQNKLLKAKEDLSDASLMAGDNKVILSNIELGYAAVAVAEKNNAKALTHIEKSLEYSNQQNGKAWERKGDVLLLANDKQGAIQAWLKAIDHGQYSQNIQNKIAAHKNS